MKCLKVVIFIMGIITSCSSKGRIDDWMNQNGKLKVLSTIAQIGDLVQEIGGDRIDVWVLIEGDLDPHSYELVKGDAEKFERADLILYNGLGLEHGASLSSLLHSSPKSLSIGSEIAKVAPDKILKKGTHNDPHVWMDVSLWSKGAIPIAEKLAQIDPDGAEYYHQRAQLLLEKMDRIHQQIFVRLQTIPSEKRYLVTSHDAFHYFTRSYLADPGESDWNKRFAAPEGLAPDGQLGPRDIQKIIDFLKDKQVSVLFPESNVSRDSIKKIASAGKELGLDLHICTESLYGDSTSGLNYFEMMEKNGETIAKHLEI